MTDKRKQVADQCKAVAHLARAISDVHSDFARTFASDDGKLDEIVDTVGQRTADLMEALGNILNGMDAVEDEDEWMEPIFEIAHKMWPASSSPRTGDNR